MTYAAEFTPVSGLVFRDARPFEAGTDTVSWNLDFPPPPEAFWSALNRVLRAGCRRASSTFSSRGLRIRAFYLVDDRGPLLPAMADLASVRQAADPWAPQRLSLLRPWRTGAGGDGELNLVWLADCGVRSWPCEGQFMRPETFLLYLLGAVSSLGADSLVKPQCLVAEDLRTGVELRGRVAREGRLYTSPVMFLDRVSRLRFGAVFEAPGPLPESLCRDHIVRLGGEGKLAHLSIAPYTRPAFGLLPEDARNRVYTAIWTDSQGKPPFRVKLCLLTPAVFSARKELLQLPGTQTPAWRPFWMSNSKHGWCRQIFDDQPYRVRLVAAVAPKAFPLGAWDRASNMPRPLHRCQPAGTVYFLELEPVNGATPEAALDQFFDDFWLGTLLVKVKPTYGKLAGVRRTRESVSPYGLRGFGWTVIGVWNYARSDNELRSQGEGYGSFPHC